MPKKFNTENINEWAETLKAGEEILLSGVIYTARDAVHKRLNKMLDMNERLPINISGATIYYAGPTPSNNIKLAVGACGPTTSSRMDVYTPRFLDLGLKCMIGKGERSQEVIDAIIRNKALYLCAIGGAGALASRAIKSCEVVAFPELGCESLKKMVIEDFSLITAITPDGENIFNRK